MNSLSTEAFPFTIAYVCELLRLDESRVLTLCQKYNVMPHQDERTGRLFFGQQQIETLRKAIEMEQKQEQLAPVSQRVAPAGGPPLAPAKSQYSSLPQRASLSRADLSLIVESVSNAKEEILRDLSHLLDDKLSGLDEVVVELIRSKSENDSLREELKRMEEAQSALQQELTKFKPAAFGFYRKDT